MFQGIDVDCHEGRVYWSDVNGGAIKSTFYDGSKPENFLSEGTIQYRFISFLTYPELYPELQNSLSEC